MLSNPQQCPQLPFPHPPLQVPRPNQVLFDGMRKLKQGY